MIELYQGSRILGSTKVRNGKWKYTIPGDLFGIGSVTLSAIVSGSNDDRIYRKPFVIEIKPSTSNAAIPEGASGPGLLATMHYKNGSSEVHKIVELDGQFNNLFDEKAVLEKIRIEGQIRVNQSGFHQLTIRTKGKIIITVDGKNYQRNAPANEYGLVYLPMFLEQGWHDLSIQPSPDGMEKLTVLLSGDQVPMILGGKQVRHDRNIM